MGLGLSWGETTIREQLGRGTRELPRAVFTYQLHAWKGQNRFTTHRVNTFEIGQMNGWRVSLEEDGAGRSESYVFYKTGGSYRGKTATGDYWGRDKDACP